MNNTLWVISDYVSNGYKAESLELISVIALLFGTVIIVIKNPISSLMCLIGLFGTIAVYLILTGLNFIGFSYLIVYIGAVYKYVWNNVAASVRIRLYKGLFILIKFFSEASPVNTHRSLSSMNRDLAHRVTIYNVVYSTYSKFYAQHAKGGKRFYSNLCSSGLQDEEFYKWFAGFADGESNFTIVWQKDTNGNITGTSFRFTIELHIDDINTLKYIQSKLNIGNKIAVYGNSCKF